MDHCTSLGFPLWTDNMRPCMDCNASTENWAVVDDCSLDRLRWRENDDEAYFTACSRCEMIVDVTADDHPQLCLSFVPTTGRTAVMASP